MRPPRTVSAPPARATLLFDGDCGFCRFWVRRWGFLTAGEAEYVAYQESGSRFPEIPVTASEQAVQLIEPGGRWTSGAEAVFRLLAYRPSLRWLLWLYENVPGTSPVSEAVYEFVARRRPFFSKVTRWFWGATVEPPTYQWVRWFFLRGLSLVYLVAFLSLLPQIVGLLGENGILPARLLMAYAHRQMPGHWAALPTLAWFRVDDGFLRFLCAGGAALALAGLLGFLSPLVFFLLWLFYLSLTVIGGDFLSFQWDLLLLEAGFLAIWLAPACLHDDPRRAPRASPSMIFLLRWLLFRLMLQSAIVKWASGDPTWHHFTALQVYYETMPLPNAMSWVMHQLPAWFDRLSVGGVFFVEGAIPFLIFLPRRPRLWAAAWLAALQGMMLLTGNYGFFNWLTLLLCTTLLDDQALRRWIPSRWRTPASEPPCSPSAAHSLNAVVFVIAFAMTSAAFSAMFGRIPAFARPALEAAAPFRSFNSYGLFAVMTTERPEIIVEGSRDGKEWLPYEFKYKVQDPMKRPEQVAPYMPRLDWQMWFAALGSYRQSPWFLNFCLELLRGSPEVLKLLKANPFSAAPPRYVRARLYRYHFTGAAEHRRTGAWWRREELGLYLPPIALRG